MAKKIPGLKSTQSSQVTVQVMLVAILLFLWTFSGLNVVAYWLPQPSQTPVIAQVTDERAKKQPSQIYSQWFLEAPVRAATWENGEWQTFTDAVAYWESSALPGENGNIILYGHNVRPQLGNIRAYKGGETITLTTVEGKKFQYKVVKTLLTKATDTQWLNPTHEEVLTLYTCDGWWDTERFIVRALPIQEVSSL